MARSNATEVFTKKNSKLEVFLKKALLERTFDRIRGYESCIENKAFKYIILGDEWIYLTENPAKTIQQSVWLGDVISVDLVNDYPEFLSGEERENSQHLAVRFLTTTSRRQTFWKSRRLTNGSLHENDRSNTSTPQGSLSEDYGYITQSMSSLYAGGSRPSSQNSLRDKINFSKKPKKGVNASGDNADDIKSHRGTIDEERLEDIEECDLFDRSYDGSVSARAGQPLADSNERYVKNKFRQSSNVNGQNKSQLKCPEIITTQPAPTSAKVRSNNFSKNGEETNCCLQGWCRSRSKSPSPPFISSASNKTRLKRNSIGPVTSSELEFELNKDELANRDDISEIIEVPNIRSILSPRVSSDHLSPRATPLSSSRLSTPLLRSRTTTPQGDISQDGRSSRGGDLVSMNGDSSVMLGEKRVAVLNIYLLSRSSPMLMLIRSACNNFMIRATLMIDPEFEKNTKSDSIRASYNQIEKMDALFVQLKRELFSPDNSIEDMFELTNELGVAAEKNFTLKKIFWKNSDMFPFLVHLIQSYIPTSKANLNTVMGRQQRHDEIELVILLTDVISLMFRETELIPARFQTLRAQRGKSVLDLLRVLTCYPEIPEKQVAPSGRAAVLLQSFQDEGYSTGSNSKVAKLLCEFTDVSLNAVFELFLMAKQANWNDSSDNFLNISWMVQVLEELSTTERYVEHVIQQMMELISPSHVDPLTPVEAVKLYRHFSVILTFLSYSPRVTFFIRNNYMEEFKYFVQPAVIERKLSANYPITRETVRLIEDVLLKVLQVSGVNLTSAR